MSNWHTMDTAAVAERLDTSPQEGLAFSEALQRLVKHGKNTLIDRGAKSPWLIFAEQLKSLLVILLIVAAAVSGAVLGEWTDAGVIFVIVILNAVLGFRQEFKAEKAMAALKKLSAPLVRVRRGDKAMEVESSELALGDVVYLEAGNVVPADGRLFEVAELHVEEASLTGESLPVTKQTEPLDRADTPLGDRRNMVYMGTTVSYGRGVFIVTETGMSTELGKIADRLQSVEKETTPLQKQLARLGKLLVAGALVLIAIVAGIGFLQGESLRTVFLTAVSMAVAAVPEGLPAAVTIALAVGAQRMLGRKALIRKLPAVETLGSVTTICSDKTGTLTQNQMTVTKLWLPTGTDLTVEHDIDPKKGVRPSFFEDHPSSEMVIAAGALCTDAELVSQTSPGGQSVTSTLGDPTEGALVVAAARTGIPKRRLQGDFPRVAEAPFDSERKRMTTVHRLPPDLVGQSKGVKEVLSAPLRGDEQRKEEPGEADAKKAKATHVAFAKGAADTLLEVCSHVWLDGEIVALDEPIRQRISDRNSELASEGVRVLGVAFRRLFSHPEGDGARQVEADLVFLGLVGMIDPVRPEVVRAVAECVSAGIRPVMITGDHPLMARHIARDLRMLPATPTNEASPPADVEKGPRQVITGREIQKMTDSQLDEVVADVSVYARVAPEHKLRIVDALQRRGHICAMTGDGVNDAPALKTADIGVAMGITGTDVSKQASDMVLRDDNFATIVAAVEEGRTIFGNIRRFVRYLLACNTGELWLFLMAPLLGMPLPLLPVQILWMNLVTDGFPALGLGIEPPERDIMMRPPRSPRDPILGWSQVAHVVWVGLVIAATGMTMAYFQWQEAGAPAGAGHGAVVEATVWQTMLFSTVVFSQLFLSFAERADRDSILTIGLLTNPHMIFAVAGTFLLQLGVIYLGPAQRLFGTTALTWGQLGTCVALGLIVFVAVELEKSLKRLRPIKKA
jgi:Ca2+-transporting ATPase